MQRVIAALHQLRHSVRQEEAFAKAKKLTTIRRGLRPKFGQLNGERTQTIEVVSIPPFHCIYVSIKVDMHRDSA